MADFQFLQNPVSKKWVILAPRRSKRTNVKTPVVVCPFCPGKENEEEEIYRKGGRTGDSNWKIRVVTNKFPFTPHHEIVIHSPDHHKNFDELPFKQVELIFKIYRQRFNAHQNNQVYIFHNRGHSAGESIPHPHTQITVIPDNVNLVIPKLDVNVYSPVSTSKRFGFWGRSASENETRKDIFETDSFMIFCPLTSEWPDEVWIAPKKSGDFFGSISDDQVKDLAFTISRLIQIFDVRHGSEFPFNFYIYPGKNWYLRFIPRLKILGGFELGTNIIVNTQDPAGTLAFISEHFWKPDNEKIKKEHSAEYWKSV
jgi:UDPglucose--hexose-1-phosphate uridylyltransferase